MALGLAWCEPSDGPAATHDATKDITLGLGHVREWLLEQDRSALVELVMEQAGRDEGFERQLLLAATKVRGHGERLATLRRVIDSAVSMDEFVPYEEAWDYAQGIDHIVDSLAEMAGSAQATEAIDLIEYALAAVENAISSVDDSDGALGGILARLQEAHLAACRRAKPDPEALAAHLFAWEMKSEWEVFFGAAATYADVLGERGLAVYRHLAEAKWKRLPELRPSDSRESFDGRRFRITSIMETLAVQTGDLEALVAVKTRDLSSPYAFLEIAGIYLQTGDTDRALDWARQGIAAFRERTDPRLREFLADLCHQLGRHDEAMEVVWDGFIEHPHATAYANLRGHAERGKMWPAWRGRALQAVRERIAAERRETTGRRSKWRPQADHSSLVRIFLDEGDLDAAWREALEGGCQPELRLELADRREVGHPEDALAVWKEQMEPTIAGKNADAYRRAIALLRRIHGVLARLGREHEFTAYLAALRVTHKRLRNLMKMLEHASWA